MIKSIDIENFRCFHQTRIDGFGRINLIGGQNNAGKTTLLEAVYLANSPQPKSVLFLKQKLRNEANDSEHPERAWSSLFYQLKKNNEIKLFVETADRAFGGRFLCKELTYEKQRQTDLFDENEDEDGLIKIEDDSDIKVKISQSSLIVYYYDQHPFMQMDANEKVLDINRPLDKNKDYSVQIDAVLGKKSFGTTGYIPTPLLYPNFVPAGFKSNPATLAENFERLRYQGRDQVVLAGLQLIEPSIERVEVFNFGEKRIYLKKKEEAFMPITSFGDALNKITDIVMRISNNLNSIILIDEVENGVHYSHHRDLWKFIFELATQFQVQIFAASHSYEMIRAFNEMATAEKWGKEAMYFEMYRSLRSGEIVGKGFSPDLLAYALANNQSFRGE